MENQIPQVGSSQTVQASDGTALNPLAVNLAKSIRQTESGTNYNAVGDNGESHGAYQFNKNNFHDWAAQYGLDPNDFSPVNQDKVAYSRINDLLKQGRAPSEVAAIWNGSKLENGTYTPINPKYVDKVKQNYAAIVSGSGDYAVPQTTEGQGQTPPPPTLGQELSKRGQDASTALGQAGTGVGEVASGNIGSGVGDIASGALQTAGAVAGGIGDVAQKGLELIPGVKSLESGLGDVLGGLANTSLGKQVVGAVNDFVQAHPEVSKDIGAALNIASVVPLFKAASLVWGAGKDAVGAALKDTLTNAAGNEIEGVAMKTVGGQQLLKTAATKGIDPIKTILDTGALPTVESDAAGVARYSTQDAFHALSTQPEEDALQQTIAQVGTRASLQDAKQNALTAVQDAFKSRTDYDAAVRQVNGIFDSYIQRYGETPTLNELNDIKRGVRESVNFKSPKLDSDLHYIIGQSLMDDIEQTAKTNGVKGVEELNQQMAAKIEAKKLLKLMDGKQVRVTKMGKWARRLKIGVGSTLGNAAGGLLGVPLGGAIAGAAMESGAAAPKTALMKLGNLNPLAPSLSRLGKIAPLGLVPQLLRNRQSP